jgi:cytochrome b pre-mRNA-processing protein 3
MLGWLRRRSPIGRTASGIYGRVVAQARQPAFYATHQVPDTHEGRFDLIVLHLFLALERLRAEGEAGQPLGQAVMEAFVTDMDDAMREIGISDLGVPRRIKKTAAAVLERFEDYRAALAQPNDIALTAAIGRHLVIAPESAGPIAAYMRATTEALSSQPRERILAGEVSFVIMP